jgi:HlyD family secretion protein
MTEKQPSPRQNRRTQRLVKQIIYGLLLLGAAGAVAFAAMPQPIEVELATSKTGELLVTVNEDGVARIRDRYSVSSPLAGNLARLQLRAGDEVNQGQVIAHILPLSAPLLDARTRIEAQSRVSAALAGLRQSRAQIERAQTAVEYAKAEAKSTNTLVRKGTLSERDLERAELDQRSRQAELSSAQFAANVATHELAMARSALGRFDGNTDQGEQFEITSPTTGRVLKVLQQSEGVIPAGAPLLEIGDPQALEIAVDVLTSDAVEIKPGAHAVLVGWGGAELSAVVRLLEPSAFSRVSALGVEEQRVNTLIDLTEPYEKWKALGDGYRVEARIEVYRNPKAIQIPWNCIFRDGSGWAVYAVQDGVARKRPVTVGRRNETDAEILQGLTPGTVVVRHPSDRVGDGVNVRSLKD